jgi:hypothetical protein
MSNPFALLENAFESKLGPKLGLFPKPHLLVMHISSNPISNLVDPNDDYQASPFKFILLILSTSFAFCFMTYFAST